jgi:hypothetical protein
MIQPVIRRADGTRTVTGVGRVRLIPQHPQTALVAAGQDLGVQVGCLVDAVGESLPQVGVERGEDAGPTAGVRADQRLGGGGAGVPAGGPDIHVEPAGRHPDRQPLGPQGVHGGVAVAVLSTRRPVLTGATVAGTARADIGSMVRLQAPAVSTDDLLDGVAEVLEQMPAVGDLDRVRRTHAGTVGIAAPTILADDLDSGVRGEPVGEGVGGAVGQYVDRPAGVHVEQHGGVAVSTPSTVGVTVAGSGIRRIIRIDVVRDTDTVNRCASRLPGRPPNATATASRSPAASTVSRAYRRVNPGTCSTNVRRRHPPFKQANRRTVNATSTSWPPSLTSANRRT